LSSVGCFQLGKSIGCGLVGGSEKLIDEEAVSFRAGAKAASEETGIIGTGAGSSDLGRIVRDVAGIVVCVELIDLLLTSIRFV